MHRTHPSRREVLGGVAAAALAARLPCAGAADKPGDAGRFDFHHHFFAPALAKKLAEKAPHTGVPRMGPGQVDRGDGQGGRRDGVPLRHD